MRTMLPWSRRTRAWPWKSKRDSRGRQMSTTQRGWPAPPHQSPRLWRKITKLVLRGKWWGISGKGACRPGQAASDSTDLKICDQVLTVSMRIGKRNSSSRSNRLTMKNSLCNKTYLEMTAKSWSYPYKTSEPRPRLSKMNKWKKSSKTSWRWSTRTASTIPSPQRWIKRSWRQTSAKDCK